MEVHIGNKNKSKALKYRTGYALAILLALAWIAAPVAAQEGGAFVGPVVVPEVFEGSLVDQQADAGAEAPGHTAGEQEVELLVLPGHSDPSEPDFQPGTWDAALDEGAGELALSPEQFTNPSPSFEGTNSTQTGFNPPDTQGDVGLDYYIQVVNAHFQIWDKDGNSLTGPTAINALWAGASDAQAACRDNNAGDPITLYDHLADRWLITQFTRPAPPDFQCIAVSRTEDPVNGGWYLYQFAMLDENGNNFSHDYPKLGVWPDGYYMGSQEGFYGGDLNLVVFDRASMLNGMPAGSQSLDGGNQTFFWLPADLDGPPPPAGTPNYFARQIDSDHYGVGGADRIEIVAFHVDWADPNNTSLSAVQQINVLPFEETLCGGGDPGLFQYCIPQPGVVSRLEALTVWPMFRLQYRNFGDRDTLVFNHTVNADGNGTAGVRWYELERATPGSGPWTLRQQGTYSPQNPGNAEPEHRWMGSIAMDRFGNLALGYSVSSENLVANGDAVNGYPSIRYTGRVDNAPLGLMPEVEVTMAVGTQVRDEDGGDQQVRWGDYSAMVVDPVDDCTFWYTQQYLTLGNNAWSTRIGAFSFADCNADLRVTKSASPSPATAGQQLTYNISVFNAGILDATDVIVTDTLPAGFSYVSDSVPGAECADKTEPTIVCNFGDIAAGSSRNYTITTLIDSAILQIPDGPTTFDNLVEVEAAQSDRLLKNNTFTLSTQVNELADLAVTKTCKPDRDAVVGEVDAYCEIYVTNNGPSLARNVTLVDEIAASGVYTIGAIVINPAAGRSCNDVSGDVECDLADIDAGDTVKVTVHVSTLLAIDVNDTATAATDTPESNYSNNSATGQIHFVVASADVRVTKQCEPSSLTAPTGSDAFCEIFVFNNGPSPAVNVVLKDEIASDGTYTAKSATTSAGTCDLLVPTDNADVECLLGTIAAGDTVKVTVVFTSLEEVDVDDIATATSDTADPNPNNNTATGSVTFAGADLIVTKQCVPALAPAGTNAVCEIFVFNNGPSPAGNVVLKDEIASDGTYTVNPPTASAGTCNPVVAAPDADVKCDLGTILAGSTVKVTVNFTSNDFVKVDDIATATSDLPDGHPDNNTATGSVTFTGVADLSVTKTDNPDSVDAGTTLTYTIGVANAGPSTAVNVVVSDILPIQTEFVSYTVTLGNGSCVAGVAGDSSRPTLCGLGDIPSGGAATIEVVVNVLPNAKGLIHNDVSVSSGTFDNDNSDNLVTEDTLVAVNTDLVLTKTDSPDPVVAGAELKYVLSLTNNGPSTATDVILVDTLPPETSLVQIKVLGGVGDCLLSQASPDIVTCTLNDMDPLESFMVVITVLVDPSVPGGTVIHNDAVVTESSGPGANASADTTVNAEADLWIDKTGYFITENPSKTIRYVLTVHNDNGCSGDDPQVCGEGGPSDAQNVVVIDDLPSTNKKLIVTFVSEDCVYNKGPHTVTCTMKTPLAAGDSVFFEIEAEPRGKLSAILNTADVSSSTFDPDGGNNSDDMLIIVSGGGQK